MTTTAAPGSPPPAAPRRRQAGARRRAPPPFPGRGQLPAELVAIPAWAGQEAAPVKVCVLCRRTADPVQGYLPQRRDTLDAKVYLGCLTDAHGVLDLLEIWVQSLDGLAEAAKSRMLTHDAVDNAVVDRRWRQLYDTAAADWPAGLLGCGYETREPAADVPGPGARAARPPRPSGPCAATTTGCGPPACRRTPAPCTGTCRHPRRQPLRPPVARRPADRRHGRVRPGAAAGQAGPVQPRRRADAGQAGRAPAAGRVGRPARREEGTTGPPTAAAGSASPRTAPWPPRPAGSCSPDGSPSRLVESYLLKLQLWTNLVEETARFTAAAGRPLLNLGPNSFAVRLADTAAGLPALWTTAAA